MIRTHFVAVAAAVAAAAIAPPALARPASDVTFGGKTSENWPVMLQISRDGRHVVYAVAAWSARCTDGNFGDYEEFGHIRVSSRGRFSTSYDTGSFQDGTATVRYAASLAGKINRRRSRITGKVRVMSSEKDPAKGIDSTCDTGKVRYLAVN